jgi:hypothetical protein
MPGLLLAGIVPAGDEARREPRLLALMASTVRPRPDPGTDQEVIATANRSVQPRRAASALPSELASLLRADECPACQFLGNAERSFFSWFVNENHTSATVQAQLRASMGMCPAHSRRLIDDPGAGPVVTTVVGEALAGARARLRDELPAGPCPACASLSRSAGDVAHLVADGLEHEDHLRDYSKHRGVCLDHVFALSELAPPELMTVIAQRLLGGLRRRDAPATLALLGRADRDGPRRARWRMGLPELGQSGATIAQLCEHLRVDACPVCLAGGLGERRYLEWWTHASRTDDPSLRTDPGELCGAHLHDLALADAPAGRRAIDRKRAATMRALQLLLAAMPDTRRASRRRRATDGAVSREVQRILSPLHQCPACRAQTTAEVREAELLEAAMALSEVRATYEAGHGLCVRHARRLASGAAVQVTHQLVDARLAVLQWELEEIRRKSAWECRHEPAGPEQDAWLRGLAQVDGRVLIGAPARPKCSHPL